MSLRKKLGPTPPLLYIIEILRDKKYVSRENILADRYGTILRYLVGGNLTS